MAKSKKRYTLRGRDALTGRFIKVSTARKRKRTAVVEQIPLPTKRRKRRR